MKLLLRPHICSFWNEKSGFGYSAYCKYASVAAATQSQAHRQLRCPREPRFLAPERHLHYSFSLKENSRDEPS
jgi:hypothetical protein